MKTIDPSKKHAVTLIFLLDEEVTPQLFVQKVALACRCGALRPGEAVMVAGEKVAIVIDKKGPFVPGLFEPKKTTKKPVKKRRRV